MKIDWVNVSIGVAQAVGGFGAALAAFLALKITTRSTVATEASARSSEDSARATAQAARATEEATKAAEASARAAETAVRIEADRRHDDLRPSGPIRFFAKPGMLAAGPGLFARVENIGGRDYRYTAVVEWSGGGSSNQSRGVLPAGESVEVFIEYLNVNLPTTLRLLFEPEGWDCPCGRDGEGHWKRTRQIEVPHDGSGS